MDPISPTPACIDHCFTMADAGVAVEMETKGDKKVAAKRRKPKATTAPTTSDPKSKGGRSKAELVEATPRQSVDSVRYDNDDAERGT